MCGGEREEEIRIGEKQEEKKNGNEERKGGRESEPMSRREQNWTAKDPELLYER